MIKRIVEFQKTWINKDELNEVKEVLESGNLNKGLKNKILENYISEFFGIKYVVCTSSGSSALYLALASLEIIVKDDIIGQVLISDNTLPIIPTIIKSFGLEPIFVDIDPKTYNMNYKDLKNKIDKKRTKAIIVSHSFGQSSDMEKIMKIADQKGIPVIEDSSSAFGAKFKYKYCGTMGKIGCFSLGQSENITSGQGGFLVTNDDKVMNNIVKNLNFNYTMSDVTAGITLAQLKKINIIIKKKNALAKYWNKKLKEINYISIPYIKKGLGNTHTYQSYCCVVSPSVNKDKLIDLLREYGIKCKQGTYSGCSYLENSEKYSCSSSVEMQIRSIKFPIFYKLKREEIDYIIDVLKEIRNKVFM